ncbi:hypothetical protein LINGRAPRIM_LOCUS2975, partial [Linum grandiflorum]
PLFVSSPVNFWETYFSNSDDDSRSFPYTLIVRATSSN